MIYPHHYYFGLVLWLAGVIQARLKRQARGFGSWAWTRCDFLQKHHLTLGPQAMKTSVNQDFFTKDFDDHWSWNRQKPQMSWDILGPLNWGTLQAPMLRKVLDFSCREFRCKSGSHGGTSITMTWGAGWGNGVHKSSMIFKMRVSMGSKMGKKWKKNRSGRCPNGHHQWASHQLPRPLSSISCKAFKISTADGRSLGSTAQQRSTRPGPLQFIAFRFTSCHVISCLLISCHFVSSHAIFSFVTFIWFHMVPIFFIHFNVFLLINSFVRSVSQPVGQPISHIHSTILSCHSNPSIPSIHSVHSVHFTYSSWIQVISFRGISFRVVHSMDFRRFILSFISCLSFISVHVHLFFFHIFPFSPCISMLLFMHAFIQQNNHFTSFQLTSRQFSSNQFR